MNCRSQSGFISLPVMLIFIVVATLMIAMHAARTSAMFQRNYQNGLSVQADWLNLSAAERALATIVAEGSVENASEVYSLDAALTYIGDDPQLMDGNISPELWKNYRIINIDYGYEIQQKINMPVPELLQGENQNIIKIHTFASVPYKGNINRFEAKWLCWQNSTGVWQKIPLVE